MKFIKQYSTHPKANSNNARKNMNSTWELEMPWINLEIILLRGIQKTTMNMS
jgi:hypothetical protein